MDILFKKFKDLEELKKEVRYLIFVINKYFLKNEILPLLEFNNVLQEWKLEKEVWKNILELTRNHFKDIIKIYHPEISKRLIFDLFEIEELNKNEIINYNLKFKDPQEFDEVYCISVGSDAGNSYYIGNNNEYFILDLPRQRRLYEDFIYSFEKLHSLECLGVLISHNHGDHWNKELYMKLTDVENFFLDPFHLPYENSLNYKIDKKDLIVNNWDKPVFFNLKHSNTKKAQKGDNSNEIKLSTTQNYGYIFRNIIYITDTGNVDERIIERINSLVFNYSKIFLLIESNHCRCFLGQELIRFDQQKNKVYSRTLNNDGHLSHQMSFLIQNSLKFKNGENQILEKDIKTLHISTKYENRNIYCPFFDIRKAYGLGLKINKESFSKENKEDLKIKCWKELEKINIESDFSLINKELLNFYNNEENLEFEGMLEEDLDDELENKTFYFKRENNKPKTNTFKSQILDEDVD